MIAAAIGWMYIKCVYRRRRYILPLPTICCREPRQAMHFESYMKKLERDGGSEEFGCRRFGHIFGWGVEVTYQGCIGSWARRYAAPRGKPLSCGTDLEDFQLL